MSLMKLIFHYFLKFNDVCQAQSGNLAKRPTVRPVAKIRFNESPGDRGLR